MRTQRVLLGQLVIDKELPIDLFAEVPFAKAGKNVAVLKDRLAYLLDARFRPSDPLPPNNHGLTVEDVAGLLHCRCLAVVRMIRRGDLHPVSDEDGELYFDPEEIASVRRVPINPKLSLLIPPK